MKSSEILLEMSPIGKSPHHTREFLTTIVPLTYLGSDRWKVRTNPIHDISSNIPLPGLDDRCPSIFFAIFAGNKFSPGGLRGSFAVLSCAWFDGRLREAIQSR